MLNLGGAVIPMEQDLDKNVFQKIQFLVGSEKNLMQSGKLRALPMFSKEMTDFLANLSRMLLSDERAKDYVDVISYAYWIRNSSLLKERDKYHDRDSRLGRGIAFHIAPSNVPVNFAVSMTSSLLAGNGCIVRVSDKPFMQVSLICEAINRLLSEKYKALEPYFCILRYPHDESITQYLSSICDIRIIWGGDQTILKIRKAVLPPRAIELTFADRYSLALVDADAYLKEDPEKVAEKFYTDTYYTDQNACSSPRIVIWFGNEKARARECFFRTLEKKVEREYCMQPITAVDKYASFCSLAMKTGGIRLLKGGGNRLMRVEVQKLTEELMENKSGGGYFFEYEASKLTDILPLLAKGCQTVSLLGIDAGPVKEMIIKYGVRGVDRIVAMGKTMDLEFVWDGFRMIEAMTRIIYVGEK